MNDFRLTFLHDPHSPPLTPPLCHTPLCLVLFSRAGARFVFCAQEFRRVDELSSQISLGTTPVHTNRCTPAHAHSHMPTRIDPPPQHTIKYVHAYTQTNTALHACMHALPCPVGTVYWFVCLFKVLLPPPLPRVFSLGLCFSLFVAALSGTLAACVVLSRVLLPRFFFLCVSVVVFVIVVALECEPS